MNPTSPIIVFVFLAVALLTTKAISGFFQINLNPVKFTTIDGLRGYLAFFVFLHHSSIYHFYLPAWSWALPPSNLFTHFGQTSVSIFFMITGFLFFSKLIDASIKKVDWAQFFISRFLRLFPLYLVLLCLVLLVIFYMTQFIRVEPIEKLFYQIKHWAMFAIFDNPNINKYEETNGVMAGIIWSIKYEWFFYLSLPLIGFLFFKQKPKLITILISLFIVIAIYFVTPVKLIHFYPFLSGLLAALLVKNDLFLKVSKHVLFSFVILACLFCSVYFYDTAYLLSPLALTTVAFIFIAGGNTVFGILSLNVSRHLGQLSYSIYLLHTTLLFILYKVVIGMDVAGKFSSEKYWLITLGLAIILICLSFFTYYFIELPSINASAKITKKFKETRLKIIGLFKPTHTSSPDENL